MTSMNESVVEEAILEWLGDLDYQVRHGSEIAPETYGAERDDYRQVLLLGRLQGALHRINPDLPPQALDEAVRVLQRTSSPSLVLDNRDVHRLLVNGASVEVTEPTGGVRGRLVDFIDFDDPAANDWLVVNQFTVFDRSSGDPTCWSSSTASRSRTSS